MNTYTIVSMNLPYCADLVSCCTEMQQQQREMKDNFRRLNTLPKFHQQLYRHYHPTIQQSLFVGGSLTLLIYIYVNIYIYMFTKRKQLEQTKHRCKTIQIEVFGHVEKKAHASKLPLSNDQ